MTGSPLSLLAPLALSLLAGQGLAQSRGPALQLMGLEPGMEQGELKDRVARLGGALSCHSSSVDPRFAECTAGLARAPDGRRWQLLASLIEGSAAVILVSVGSSSAEVARFREELAAALGRPNLRRQADQEAYEWIRAGRMMRLTARSEAGRITMSVSLVEGSLLDGLN